ncbi:MAG: isopentenyl-diphosphate Delta-isomerase [Candidatus Zambryskibacteria bacterium]|nr:isopentenyl-diphosphate Delta-isomerase [Candidatus Zambryskibacteria bacterium]
MLSAPIEEVVLVDEKNNILGTMPKSEVHQKITPLHRGFSLFLFDREEKLLLQQRSRKKKTWPLFWSNSVCGHPGPGESNISAAKRRLSYELGMNTTGIEKVSPYRYKFVRDGIMENEICPILVGFSNQKPVINPEEVEAVRWIEWSEFLEEIKSKPGFYSDWCEEEAFILEKTARFKEILKSKQKTIF